MGNHANRGMDLEKTITHKLFPLYEQLNIFCLKIEVKQANGVYLNKSPFDFIVYHDNRMSAFDTKNCNDPKGLAISNFKLHQVKALSCVEAQGGLAFFLVYFSTIGQLELIPVSEMRDIIASGAKKVTPDKRRKTGLDFLKIL